MRRFVSTRAAFSAAVAYRNYTAPPEAVKLYQSDFTQGSFPVELVSSDVVQYAQFLYRLGEAKNETYTKDFETLSKLKLPIFWERSTDVTGFADVTKAVSPNFVFCLRWMQTQGNLEKLATVRGYYDTLMNAKNKKLVVNVFTNAAGANDSKVQSDARTMVTETMKTHPQLKSKQGFNLEFNFTVDRSIPAGAGLFYAEFGGLSLSTIPIVRADEVSASAGEVDYTNVSPLKHGVIKTQWEDNVETDVLKKYFDQLALQDEEEQKYGV